MVRVWTFSQCPVCVERAGREETPWWASYDVELVERGTLAKAEPGKKSLQIIAINSIFGTCVDSTECTPQQL